MHVPTAIAVTSRDLVVPARDRTVPSATVFERPGPGSGTLDRQLADMSLALDYYGHVVALVPAAPEDPARRRLHTVRAILESDRIALVETDLPPLAVAMLALQLRHLSATDLSPGVIAGAARLLTYYVHAGALLSSVTRLDRVEVDLKSHLRSWVPGARFAVAANPEPHLVDVSDDTELPGPSYLTHLAVAAGAGQDAEWVKDGLAPKWRPQLVHDLPLPADSARWWGTQKLVEFAAYIPDVSVLYQLVTSVRKDMCGWCGLEVIGDQCLFCSAPVDDRGQQRHQENHGSYENHGNHENHGSHQTHGSHETHAPSEIGP